MRQVADREPVIRPSAVEHVLSLQLAAGNRATGNLIQRWFTRDKTDAERQYVLDGRARRIGLTGTNHEDITEGVLGEPTRRRRFGAHASRILLHWVAAIDRSKGREMLTLATTRFPELRALGSVVAEGGGASAVEGLVHAYAGVAERDVGIVRSSEHPLGQLQGGAVERLLDAAVRNFEAGYREHALRLLGISLHTVQDFYAHNYPLAERSRAREAEGAGRVDPGPVHVLEDDPALGPDRWGAAWQRTREQLDRFYDRLSPAARTHLAAHDLRRPAVTPAQVGR
jgi:hypothetical protein